MNKIAQLNDNPLITTKIASEPLIKGVWNKYFADKHARIVTIMRGAMQLPSGEKLKQEMIKIFPLQEDFWKDLAYAPLDLSLTQIKDGMDRLLQVQGINSVPGASSAIKLYLDQYKLLTDKLAQIDNRQQQSKQQKAPPQKVPSKTKVGPDKIRKLQELLKVQETGTWDESSNKAFLAWLREHGWDKYIVNNRFTGNVDAAIRAILIEQATSEAPAEPLINMSSYRTRHDARIKQLRALYTNE